MILIGPVVTYTCETWTSTFSSATAMPCVQQCHCDALSSAVPLQCPAFSSVTDCDLLIFSINMPKVLEEWQLHVVCL
jgi:hypothetical protein